MVIYAVVERIGSKIQETGFFYDNEPEATGKAKELNLRPMSKRVVMSFYGIMRVEVKVDQAVFQD